MKTILLALGCAFVLVFGFGLIEISIIALACKLRRGK
jgi:hypothetical protein